MRVIGLGPGATPVLQVASNAAGVTALRSRVSCAPNGTARVTGKGEKERVVPIGRTALGLLENYVKGVRPFLLVDPAERALLLDEQGNPALSITAVMPSAGLCRVDCDSGDRCDFFSGAYSA